MIHTIPAYILFFILLGFLLTAVGYWQKNIFFVISGGIILVLSGVYYISFGFEYERPLTTLINQTQTFSYDAQNRTSEITTTRNESLVYENISYKPAGYNDAIGVFLALCGIIDFAFAYYWIYRKD